MITTSTSAVKIDLKTVMLAAGIPASGLLFESRFPFSPLMNSPGGGAGMKHTFKVLPETPATCGSVLVKEEFFISLTRSTECASLRNRHSILEYIQQAVRDPFHFLQKLKDD